MSEGVRRIAVAVRVVFACLAVPILLFGLIETETRWATHGITTMAIWGFLAAAVVLVGRGIAWVIDGFNAG